MITFALPTFAKTYTLAIPLHAWHSHQSDANILKYYTPLQKWLEQQTGYQFKLVGYRANTTAAKQLAKGKYSIAYMKAMAFLNAKKRNPNVTALATVTTWNASHTRKIISYSGFLLTLKTNTQIKTIHDLKNKKIAFVDPFSASGFLYPVSILKYHNIDYQTFFKKHYFLVNHVNVLNAILDGKVAAGFVWGGAWSNSPNKNKFKSLMVIPNIPNPLFAASGKLSQEAKMKIQKALIATPESVTKGLVFVGFAKTPKNYYEQVHSLDL